MDELVHGFLLKAPVQVTEQIDGDQFLVSKHGLSVIAQALKTGRGLRIVDMTDKQIELNQLNFHDKKILPVRLACLSFQLLIHIDINCGCCPRLADALMEPRERLPGRQGTTYHLMEGRRRKQLAEFGVRVIDAPLVREGNIITSTSPATAIEVALALLADLTSSENADRVRHLMGFSS